MTLRRGREHAYDLLIVLLVILAINGLIITGRFIGYASHTARAGDITELEILVSESTELWAGVYGAAFHVGQTNEFSYEMDGGDTTEANLFFVCFQNDIEHEVYASTVPEAQIDFNSLSAAAVSDIDDYLGATGGQGVFSGLDAPANTFTSTIQFEVGTNTISAPGAYTYVDTGSGTNKTTTTFSVGALIDGDGNLVLVSKVNQNLTKGFNRRLYNYQMLLPIQNGTNETYYLWSDPNDECPEGEGESFNRGNVYGTVTSETGTVLEDVLIDIAGYTTVTDASGFYNISTNEGTWNVYAIKADYKVFQGNVTVIAANNTEYNIVLEADIDEEHTADNPDIGPDFDSGPGENDNIGPYTEKPVIAEPKRIEGEDFVITPNSIRRKIRIDNFFQEVITIFSFKPGTVNVNYVVEGDAKDLIELDKDRSSINPNNKETLVATIFGRPPAGTYNGTLLIVGDITEEIPIEIEVQPRDLLPVEALVMQLELDRKSVTPGDELQIKLDLRNMLTDREYPARLTFVVQDIDGKNTIWSYSTNTLLKTSFSIIKNVKIPEDAATGDYVVRVTAEHLDLSSGVSTGFKIVTPFLQYPVLGIVPMWQLLGLSLLIAGAVLGIFIVRRRMEAKKKYHLKVEMSELPSPGPRSAWVGKIAETSKKAYFTLENFKTHTIVAGSTGGGKSFAAQGVIEEMLLKNVAVIVFDPTAQWTGMLRKLTNKGVLSLYPGFDMKPADARAFNGNIRQITDPYEKIRLKDFMKPGEIQVFAMHKMDPKDIDVFVANSIREVFHENFEESQLLRLALVYDEVHRLLPKFGGSGEGFLQIERGCREFRKWGIGIVLISQVLSDFVGQIKANINTEVQLRTRDEGDLDRIATKYGKEVLQSLVKASVGTGMVENPAYNRGKPYFVTFRPILHSVERLSDEELEQYNKYNDMIDDLSFQLAQLEELGIDVFDLKLELKLALDKVKSGNFNMVQIYLEGLTPRIKAHWEKLGKEPKKFARERVSKDDIKAELEKAKSERVKAEAEAKQNAPAAEAEKKGPPGFKTDVSPDKLLHLVNGMLVINLQSLYDEIAAMKDKDFEQHVKPPKNDFAVWVSDAVGDQELGDVLWGCSDKNEMLQALQLRKDNKPLPKPKPRPQPPTSSTPVGVEPPAAASHTQEPSSTQARVSIDALVTDDAHAFHIGDEVVIRSIRELREYIPTMSDAMFAKYVDKEKNDFATWIQGTFSDTRLASRVAAAHDRAALLEALA